MRTEEGMLACLSARIFSGRRCMSDLGVRKSGTVRVALSVEER